MWRNTSDPKAASLGMWERQDRHSHLAGLRSRRGTDKVLHESRGGRLDLGDSGRLLGGSEIGIQGLAGLRERAFRAKTVSEFPSALEGSFSEGLVPWVLVAIPPSKARHF